MKVLVVGGAASGKSAFAERVACSLAPTRTYVATMRNDGEEARIRIARHRELRAHKGFCTLECPCDLPQPQDGHPRAGVALLEDLGNLAANNLFGPEGIAMPLEVRGRLESQLQAFGSSYEHVIVVGNSVGAEGKSPWEGTAAWVELVGALSCSLAASFDVVAEVSCGIPTFVKGELA